MRSAILCLSLSIYEMEVQYKPPYRILKRLDGVLYMKHFGDLCYMVFTNQPFSQFATRLLLLLIFRICLPETGSLELLSFPPAFLVIFFPPPKYRGCLGPL